MAYRKQAYYQSVLANGKHKENKLHKQKDLANIEVSGPLVLMQRPNIF